MSATAAARLEPVAEELWTAEGPTLSFFGFPYPTRMAVARLSQGRLWVWSPVALDAALRREVEALGDVRFLVSPNKLHHLYLGAWAEAFPEARLYAPPGLAARRRDLGFHAELGDATPPEWRGEIDHVLLGGSLFMTEALFHHRASRTVLVGDLVQKLEPPPGWRGWVMRLDALTGPEGSTPREWRASFLRRGPARRALRTALGWRPRSLVIAHGRCAFDEGERVLRESLAWLRPGEAARAEV